MMRSNVVVAFALALVLGASGASHEAGSATSGATRADDLDGVWIGSLGTTAGGARLTYPLLLNLAVTGDSGRGLALLADDLAGAPQAIAFERLREVVTKRKTVTITILRETERGVFRLTLKLRMKREQLRGKLTTDDPEFKGGRVALRRLDGEPSLEQVWTGTIATGRSAVPVALLVLGGRRPGGLGFVGTDFGPLRNVVLDDTSVSGVLHAPSGDTAIDLALNRKGHLQGTIVSASTRRINEVTLVPGGTDAAPQITKVSPDELNTGAFTQVEIKGKKLAPGFMLRTGRDDAWAEAPEVLSGSRAVASVFVDAGAELGTDVTLDLFAADGSSAENVARLTTAGQAPVNYRADLQPIFNSTCALTGCHVTPPLNDPLYPDGMAAGGLVLEPSSSYANLLNQPAREAPSFVRVLPGDPERSYLIKKLRGDDDLVGNRMPASGPPFLSDEVIAMFIRWVEEGAAR